MRAPPESFTPIIGAPCFNARSITLHILEANAQPREPPMTVKSSEKAKARRCRQLFHILLPHHLQEPFSFPFQSHSIHGSQKGLSSTNVSESKSAFILSNAVSSHSFCTPPVSPSLLLVDAASVSSSLKSP